MAADGYEVKRGIVGKPKVAYKCARCHNDLESDLTDAGKKDTCPFCKAAFIVPGQRELKEIQDAAKQKEEERREAEAESGRQREEWLRLQEEERIRLVEEQRQAEVTIRAAPARKKTWVILAGAATAILVIVAIWIGYHRSLLAERLRLMDQCKNSDALDNDLDYKAAFSDGVTAESILNSALQSGDAQLAKTEREEVNRLINKEIDAREAAARKAGVPNIRLDDAQRALDTFDHEHIGIAQELGYRVGEWK